VFSQHHSDKCFVGNSVKEPGEIYVQAVTNIGITVNIGSVLISV